MFGGIGLDPKTIKDKKNLNESISTKIGIPTMPGIIPDREIDIEKILEHEHGNLIEYGVWKETVDYKLCLMMQLLLDGKKI